MFYMFSSQGSTNLAPTLFHGRKQSPESGLTKQSNNRMADTKCTSRSDHVNNVNNWYLFQTSYFSFFFSMLYSSFFFWFCGHFLTNKNKNKNEKHNVASSCLGHDHNTLLSDSVLISLDFLPTSCQFICKIWATDCPVLIDPPFLNQSILSLFFSPEFWSQKISTN